MENIVQEMSNMLPEHRIVMSNVEYVIRTFLRKYKSDYLVLREAKYEWSDVDGKYDPDISILNKHPRRKGVCYTDVPLFIAEVLSTETEKDDRNRKMNVYLTVGVTEYWLIDWRVTGCKIERYILNDDGSDYILNDVVIGLDKEVNLLTIPSIFFKVEELLIDL